MSVSNETRRILLEKGYRQCVVQFFTTNLQVNVFPYIERALSRHFPGAVVRVIHFDQPIVVSPIRPQISQDRNERKILLHHTLGAMGGNYLKIILPRGEHITPWSNVGMKAAAIVRSLFGTLAAGDLHCEMDMDMESGTRDYSHRPMYMPDDTKFYEDLMEDPNLPASDLNINPNTLTLMGESDRHDDATNFLFKWLALEAQLGNGRDRERFCLDDLSSDLINYEMNQLRAKRDAFFHDGRVPAYTPFDRLSISSMLRLAVMEAGAMRDRLSEKYEDRILEFWSNANQNQVD